MGINVQNAIHEYPVIDGGTVHDPDDLNKIKNVIQETKEDTEIFPHLNNYNCAHRSLGRDVATACGRRLSAPRCASRSCSSLRPSPSYRGLSLDIESLDDRRIRRT